MSGGKTKQPVLPLIGEQIPIAGSNHTSPDQARPYTSIPASSGDHGERIPYGEYQRELTDYETLHGLEHGAIAFWYNTRTITDDELQSLREMYASLPVFANNTPKAYLSPRSDLKDEVKIAATAWGYLLEQQQLDTEQLTLFFNGHLGKGPEQAP